MKYISGRSNLAITIFVPYDCPNNCKFCTSKKDYKNTKNFSLDKIIKSLKRVGNLYNVKDIVITGGEPFADLEQLQKLLNYAKIYNKNIFINTTLPSASPNEKYAIINFILKNKNIISGINVSRHILVKTKYEDNSILEYLHKNGINIRINSVLFGYDSNPKKSLINIEHIKNQVNEYKNKSSAISFRADYRLINNMNDLKEFDSFTQLLCNEYQYCFSGGCLVCNDDEFQTEDKYSIHYHRGKEHSSILLNDNLIVNDIVIKQDGTIYLDWDKINNSGNIDELLKQWIKTNTKISGNSEEFANEFLKALLSDKHRRRNIRINPSSNNFGTCGGSGCGGNLHC